MESNDRPAWISELGGLIEAALDASGINEDSSAAAIFIAVRPNPDGTKHVIHEIRGGTLPLAEAAASLMYNRNFPEILHAAAAHAIELRAKEDRERYTRSKDKNNINHKNNHKNKKR